MSWLPEGDGVVDECGVLEFFEGRAIVIPDFDENDPGAEHPLYVKNKDEVLESWKYESK